MWEQDTIKSDYKSPVTLCYNGIKQIPWLQPKLMDNVRRRLPFKAEREEEEEDKYDSRFFDEQGKQTLQYFINSYHK